MTARPLIVATLAAATIGRPWLLAIPTGRWITTAAALTLAAVGAWAGWHYCTDRDLQHDELERVRQAREAQRAMARASGHPSAWKDTDDR